MAAYKFLSQLKCTTNLPTDGVSIETLLQFPQEIIGGLSSCWNTYEYHVQKSEQRADDGGYLEMREIK
jgi:hypothetical protein